MNDSYLAKRTALLEQMASLDSMELGSLKAEYRPSPSGTNSGPYFKHQVWKDGANISRRVSPEEAPALESAIANRLKFESLAQAFTTVTVEHTRENCLLDTLKKKTPQASLPGKPKSQS